MKALKQRYDEILDSIENASRGHRYRSGACTFGTDPQGRGAKEADWEGHVLLTAMPEDIIHSGGTRGISSRMSYFPAKDRKRKAARILNITEEAAGEIQGHPVFHTKENAYAFFRALRTKAAKSRNPLGPKAVENTAREIYRAGQANTA